MPQWSAKRMRDRNSMRSRRVSTGTRLSAQRVTTTSRHDGLARWTRIAAYVLPVIAGWIAFHGAFRFGFAQDDWIRLESGLQPLGETFSQLLSHGVEGRRPTVELYFAAWVRLVGPNATAFHLAAACIHSLNVVLVHYLALRLMSPPVAFLGALFFAVHCAAFTVLYWTACAPELLCTGFSLASLVFVIAPSARWRWSIPLYMAALGAKETALLLPLVAAALWWAAGVPGVAWRRRILVMAAVGAGYGILYVIIKEGLVTPAYPLEVSPGGMLARAGTYLAWAFGFAARIAFVEEATGLHQALAIVATLVLSILSWIRGGRERRSAVLGLAWFVAFTLPAAAIAGHMYRYLLYLPLPGMIFVAAPAVELGIRWLSRRRGAPRYLPAAVAVVAAAGIGIAAVYASIRTERTAAKVDGVWNLQHFVVRRADIAGRVLAQAAADVPALGPGSTVIFMGADGKADWWDTNVRVALADGAALRVAFGKPDLEVRFVERDVGRRIDVPSNGRSIVYLYNPYGRLKRVPAGGLGSDAVESREEAPAAQRGR
jgi:hypothetical protein